MIPYLYGKSKNPWKYCYLVFELFLGTPSICIYVEYSNISVNSHSFTCCPIFDVEITAQELILIPTAHWQMVTLDFPRIMLNPGKGYIRHSKKGDAAITFQKRNSVSNFFLKVKTFTRTKLDLRISGPLSELVSIDQASKPVWCKNTFQLQN